MSVKSQNEFSLKLIIDVRTFNLIQIKDFLEFFCYFSKILSISDGHMGIFTIVEIDLAYGRLQHKQRPPKYVKTKTTEDSCCWISIMLWWAATMYVTKRFVFHVVLFKFHRNFSNQLFVYIFQISFLFTFFKSAFCLQFSNQLFVYNLQISCLFTFWEWAVCLHF